MENIRKEQGSITLEASIVLTMFMFFILFLYSFFIVFQAQGKIGSALLRCTQSLSLDAYATEQLFGDTETFLPGSVTEFLIKVGCIDWTKNTEFVSKKHWYSGNNRGLEQEVEKRFTSYLTNDNADHLLKTLRVEGGLQGLDFSKTCIDNEGNLQVIVSYKLNYIFNYPLFNIEPLSMTQKAESHMWKFKGN